MAEKNASRCLTSLLLVEERLVEADFFVRKMMRAGPDTVGYFLNAFLSAARSVTFLLQKELAHVTGFRQWWEAQRLVLGADATARFFLELRNFSQKEGRASLAGVKTSQGRSSRWTFLFVGVQTSLPNDLQGVDAADACAEHIAKLARVVLACMEAFPFQTCPSSALSAAGVEALGLDAEEMFKALGLPFVDSDDGLAWRVLRDQVDAVDVAIIRKLASGRSRRLQRRPPTASDALSAALLSSVERQLRGPAASLNAAQTAFELLVGEGPDGTGSPGH
jgi:hypothetical protein